MGLLTSMLGGGLSASSSAATGDTSVGQNFGFSAYSPFAVGPGASATASGTAPASNATAWILAAAAALAAGVAIWAVMKK